MVLLCNCPIKDDSKRGKQNEFTHLVIWQMFLEYSFASIKGKKFLRYLSILLDCGFAPIYILGLLECLVRQGSPLRTHRNAYIDFSVRRLIYLIMM
ncbi:hypothetical protein Nepgr_009125 [Nepenthes gracilis]|uniref:Uncharacterized protein n=1 Tax=Nepenthes gracilis TaxID=150966 RepID=A0AAD3SAA1_NEPGR|nr:hypothetical protein Nepgr_009125 [Nepenthes gracilis]